MFPVEHSAASGARSSRVGGPQRRRAWGAPNRELWPHPFIAIRSTSPGARLRGRTGRLAGALPARAPEGHRGLILLPLLVSRGAPLPPLAPAGGDVVTSHSTRHRVEIAPGYGSGTSSPRSAQARGDASGWGNPTRPTALGASGGARLRSHRHDPQDSAKAGDDARLRSLTTPAGLVASGEDDAPAAIPHDPQDSAQAGEDAPVAIPGDCAALVAALPVITGAVLPAEYGVDPLGTGRAQAGGGDAPAGDRSRPTALGASGRRREEARRARRLARGSAVKNLGGGSRG